MLAVHLLREVHIKLPCSEVAKQCQGVQALGVALLLESTTELEHGGILLFRGVARVSRLRSGSGGGKVVVVVFGIGL